MARMRTIPEAIRYIKTNDPDSALTPHALRLLVLSGKFPHVQIGAKRLVDVDLLERFMSGEFVPQNIETSVAQPGIIRRLPEWPA